MPTVIRKKGTGPVKGRTRLCTGRLIAFEEGKSNVVTDAEAKALPSDEWNKPKKAASTKKAKKTAGAKKAPTDKAAPAKTNPKETP